MEDFIPLAPGLSPVEQARAEAAADIAERKAYVDHQRASEDAAALGVVGIAGTRFDELGYTQNTFLGRPISVTGPSVGSAPIEGMFSSQFGAGA